MIRPRIIVYIIYSNGGNILECLEMEICLYAENGIENLYATGMMIKSDRHAHMSTRNTVSCTTQG
jgi:hypothetical protein